MTERATATIAALRSGHDRLAARVRGLSADGLARPSGAAEWSVAQVLSHLGSGAEIGLATLRAALQGGDAPDGDFNKSVWARWDAMGPAEHAAHFLTADEALVRAFEELDANALRDLRVHLGFLPEPLDAAGYAGMRLSEHAQHSWDVEVAFDDAAALPAEAVPPLLERAGALLAFTSRPEALEGRPVRFAVHLSAPERAFGVEVGETVALTAEPADPDAVLTAPAEWWLRLLAGRHAPRHTPEGTALTGTGLTLDDLRRLFPGF